jgi:hypothetical protein
MRREEGDIEWEAPVRLSSSSREQNGVTRFKLWGAKADLSELPSASERDGELEIEEVCRLLLAHTELGFWHRALALRDCGILWCLLTREAFQGMDERASDLLVSHVRAASDGRGTLRTSDALMAVALWRHGDDVEHELGRRCLCSRAFPIDHLWIYELTQFLGRDSADREVGSGRQMIDLARLYLEVGFFDSSAHLAGFFLVRRLDRWVVGSAEEHLLRACDAAASQDPFRWSVWLRVLAHCAKDGGLRHGWLEKPVEATIRLHVGDARRLAAYRSFHSLRLYEVDSARLRELHQTWFHDLRRGGKKNQPWRARAFDWLVGEMDETAVENPYRALRLGECILDELERLRDGNLIQRVEQRLARLYFRCLCVEPGALAMVRGQDLSEIPPADRETFFRIADYRHGFDGLQSHLAGVKLEHADKDAAYRVLASSRRPWAPHPIVAWIGKAPADLAQKDRLVEALQGVLEFCGEAVWPLSQKMFRRAKTISTGVSQLAVPVQPRPDSDREGVLSLEERMASVRHRALLIAVGTGGASGFFAAESPFVGSLLQAVSMAAVVEGLVGSYRNDFDLGRSRANLRQVLLGRIMQAPCDTSQDHEKRVTALFVRAGTLVGTAGSSGLLSLVHGSGLGGGVLRPAKHKPALGSLRAVAERWGWVEGAPRERSWARASFASLLGAFVSASFVYDCCETAELIGIHSFLSAKYPEWRIEGAGLPVAADQWKRIHREECRD